MSHASAERFPQHVSGDEKETDANIASDQSTPHELTLHPVDGLPRWVGFRIAKVIMRAVSMEEQLGADRSSMVTKTRGYFRRDRHVHPAVDPETYRLTISGVAEGREFTLKDLHALNHETRVCVQECAGNGNHFMGSAGLLGQAVWAGPRLEHLLELASGPGDASHFAFHGLDRIGLGGLTLKRGYHYGLSLEELLEAKAIIALTMNGEPLSRRHGFPARLVVPRIYSMSHVKWLGHIEGKTEPHMGIHNRLVFTNKEQRDGRWVRVQARWIGLKSLICHCRKVEDGWELTGCAWGGDRPVERVEVSCDHGQTWSEAQVQTPAEYFKGDASIEAPAIEGAWSVFTYVWRSPAPGDYRIGARAINDRGDVQSIDNDPNVKGHFNQTRVKWRDVTVPG